MLLYIGREYPIICNELLLLLHAFLQWESALSHDHWAAISSEIPKMTLRHASRCFPFQCLRSKLRSKLDSFNHAVYPPPQPCFWMALHSHINYIHPGYSSKALCAVLFLATRKELKWKKESNICVVISRTIDVSESLNRCLKMYWENTLLFVSVPQKSLDFFFF